MQRLQLPIIRYQIRAAVDEEYQHESRLEHKAVFDSIINADPDAAESNMRMHLRKAAGRILKLSPTFRN
ncbi:hypothetical protein D3C75_1367000 [compost metagenome]